MKIWSDEVRALWRWAAVFAGIVAGGTFPLHAETIQTLSNFTHGNAGAIPSTALTDVNGLLYGGLSLGGANYAGAIFQLDPATGVEKIVYSFAPSPPNCFVSALAPLVELSGVLYGILQCGGPAAYGQVFAFDPSTARETVVYSFTGGSDGRFPTSLIAFDGALYGTAFSGGVGGKGVVFQVDPANGAQTVLHAFDASGDEGAGPEGLTASGSALYGVTNSGGGQGSYGAIFKVDLASGQESTLHDFTFTGTNGGYAPQASPIIVDRVLYGTLSMGGAHGFGSVYKFAIDQGGLSTLYSFSNTGDGGKPTTPLTFVRGSLFGTVTCFCAPGYGLVYEVNPSSGAEKTLYSFHGGQDGVEPQTGLIAVHDTLFGTTGGGGSDGNGTVFSVVPDTGAEAVVYSFTGQPRLPNASMIDVGGMLYGTTAGDGSLSFGTLYQIDPVTGQQTTLHTFTGGADDGNPGAALVYSQGALFGTTSGEQVPASNGTIFRFDPTHGVLATLYRFSGGADGSTPYSALTALDGVLYGTTQLGGASGAGTVFKFDPANGAETVVYAFTGFGDGGYPVAGVTNVGGILYGATAMGGAGGQAQYQYGVVFKLDPSTGVETPLYAFPGGDGGGQPSSQLTAGKGFLYGATYSGWVFAVELANGGVYLLCNPSTASAVIPTGPDVFGTAAAIPGNPGSVFSCNASTGALRTLYSFTNGADGGDPRAALTATGHGLYGTTSAGGADAAGTIFKVLTQ